MLSFIVDQGSWYCETNPINISLPHRICDVLSPNYIFSKTVNYFTYVFFYDSNTLELEGQKPNANSCLWMISEGCSSPLSAAAVKDL